MQANEEGYYNEDTKILSKEDREHLKEMYRYQEPVQTYIEPTHSKPVSKLDKYNRFLNVSLIVVAILIVCIYIIIFMF